MESFTDEEGLVFPHEHLKLPPKSTNNENKIINTEKTQEKEPPKKTAKFASPLLPNFPMKMERLIYHNL